MGGSDRKRLVMWRRLMLIHAATTRSHGPVTDDGTPRLQREVPKPVAGSQPARAS
jgi:hypothetical protein